MRRHVTRATPLKLRPMPPIRLSCTLLADSALRRVFDDLSARRGAFSPRVDRGGAAPQPNRLQQRGR